MSKRRPNGDGMVRKRPDGRWEARIIVGHKEDGKPIYKSVFGKTQSGAITVSSACFLSDSDNKIAFFSLEKYVQYLWYFIFVFCIIFGFGKSRQMI